MAVLANRRALACTIAAMAEIDKTNPDHRHRLLEGMAQSVAEKGYADTTIADVVRLASVSRRTFYEHFASKPECLIALYETASHNALGVLRGAIDPSHPWQAQIDQALAAYLGTMTRNPVLLRTMFIEMLGLGAPGLAARRRVNREIADFMVSTINAGARPQGQVLSADMAMAVVGGINELILQYIEQDKVDDLLQLVGPASRLVRAVTAAPAN
jgi:AcrR family transcriptional regulator